MEYEWTAKQQQHNSSHIYTQDIPSYTQERENDEMEEMLTHTTTPPPASFVFFFVG